MADGESLSRRVVKVIVFQLVSHNAEQCWNDHHNARFNAWFWNENLSNPVKSHCDFYFLDFDDLLFSVFALWLCLGNKSTWLADLGSTPAADSGVGCGYLDANGIRPHPNTCCVMVKSYWALFIMFNNSLSLVNKNKATKNIWMLIQWEGKYENVCEWHLLRMDNNKWRSRCTWCFSTHSVDCWKRTKKKKRKWKKVMLRGHHTHQHTHALSLSLLLICQSNKGRQARAAFAWQTGPARLIEEKTILGDRLTVWCGACHLWVGLRTHNRSVCVRVGGWLIYLWVCVAGWSMRW